MSNKAPKQIDNTPILIPEENMKVFSVMQRELEIKSKPKNRFEARGQNGFKSGYSNPAFDGHDQSMSLPIDINYDEFK
jgi:hypothetical protein